jgi:hypothetical protein
MSARLGTFRIALLPGVAHSEETMIILNNEIPTSHLVREAILHKARKANYQTPNGKKPHWIISERWKKYLVAQGNSRYIDYSYYLAFYWLKSLSEFQYISSGSLIRKALVEYCN